MGEEAPTVCYLTERPHVQSRGTRLWNSLCAKIPSLTDSQRPYLESLRLTKILKLYPESPGLKGGSSTHPQHCFLGACADVSTHTHLECSTAALLTISTAIRRPSLRCFMSFMESQSQRSRPWNQPEGAQEWPGLGGILCPAAREKS